MKDYIYYFAHKTPDKIAIYTKNESYSYSELNDEILKSMTGIKESCSYNKVGLCIEDPVHTIILFWACLRLNKRVYMFNYRVQNNYYLMKKKYNLPKIFTNYITSKNKFLYKPDFDIHSPNIALLTSGSTGLPKCVLHTVSNAFNNAQHVVKECSFNSSSKWYLNLPLYHVSGLSIIFRCFLVGGSIVLEDKHNYFMSFTHMSCVQKQFYNLCDSPPSFELKCVLLGGSAIDNALLKKGLDLFPIYKTYGLTETFGPVTLSKINYRQYKSSGQVLDHSKIRLVKTEICIQSKSLAYGYELPSNEISLLNGNYWFKTKDSGSLTPSGYLYIKGRLDNMCIINGENIFPEVIETVIKEYPNILDCIVVSIEINNEVILVAFILTDQLLNNIIFKLKNHIKQSLSNLFVPNKFFNFPKTAGLKYSRYDLIQYALGQLK